MQHFLNFSVVSLLTLIYSLSAPVLLFSTEIKPNAVSPSVRKVNDRYIRMADNFFILYDPSTNMDVPYKNTGLTRIEAQKTILQKSNATLPELGWQAGLYPHWKGGLWLHGSVMAFKPYYPLHRYENATYGEAIDMLPTTSQSPPMLQTGLMKLEHLLGLSGKTEVFIFSDGNDSTYASLEPFPIDQAQKIVDTYDVCFTVISSAKTPEEKQTVNTIGSLNECSQVIDFDTVYDNPEHLFGRLYMDTQNNGFGKILFDFDKTAIKPEHVPVLDKLGDFLQKNPELYTVLSGFTDSIGTEKYNINLSKRRAESAQNYLLKKYNLPKERVLLYWYGYTNPVAPNDTAEGRQQNRRVTVAIRNNN